MASDPPKKDPQPIVPTHSQGPRIQPDPAPGASAPPDRIIFDRGIPRPRLPTPPAPPPRKPK